MSIRNEDRPAYPTPFLERSEGADRAHSFITDLGEYEPQLLGFTKFERASLLLLAGTMSNPEAWLTPNKKLVESAVGLTKELFAEWRKLEQEAEDCENA